jgi:hypothetical protein
MDLGDRLQRWWDRVRGYEPPAAKPVNRAVGTIVRPVAARPVREIAGSAEGASLKLSVSDKPTEQPSRRHGEAGFDPYANSAGYHKPGGWDEVQRK